MLGASRTIEQGLIFCVMGVVRKSIVGRNASGAVDDIQQYGMLLTIYGHKSQERLTVVDYDV